MRSGYLLLSFACWFAVSWLSPSIKAIVLFTESSHFTIFIFWKLIFCILRPWVGNGPLHIPSFRVLQFLSGFLKPWPHLCGKQSIYLRFHKLHSLGRPFVDRNLADTVKDSRLEWQKYSSKIIIARFNLVFLLLIFF